MTPEAALKAKIKAYLKKNYPQAVQFSPIAGRFSTIGVSDIVCCIEGRFVALEVKVPGNHATTLQKDFIMRVEAAGGIAGVVYSVTDVDTLLKQGNLSKEVK